MRVAHSAPDSIDIRGREAMRAPLLLGVALILCVALALLVVPDARSRAHIGAWAIVGLAGFVATFFGWPRGRHIELRRRDGIVRVAGTHEPMDVADGHLRLSAVRSEGATGFLYGVVLERDSGASVVLLSDERPERVLRDLEVIRRVVPFGVSAGWGLPSESPWTKPPSGSQSRGVYPSPPPSVPVPAPASRRTKRSIAGTLLVGSTGVAVIIIANVVHRLELGETPSTLSLALPIIAISVLVIIGGGIWTSRSSLELGSALSFARFVYGMAIDRRLIARSAIRTGYLVSPDGTKAKHLLLDTDSGPVSFPCDPVAGTRVLAALYGGGPEISSAPPVQSRE